MNKKMHMLVSLTVRRPALGTRLGLARILFTEASVLVTTDADSRLGRARGGDSANHAEIRIFGQCPNGARARHDLSANG